MSFGLTKKPLNAFLSFTGGARMYPRLLDYDSEHVISSVGKRREGDSGQIQGVNRRKQWDAALTQSDKAANDGVD